jgi:initiation factor 1A
MILLSIKMVKNKFGGNKAKSVARKKATHSKKELVLRQVIENEEYAKVNKMLGDRRLLGILPDKKEIIAHIPNRIKKRIFPGDIILVVPQIEGVESKKFSVIYAYDNDDVRELIKLEELDKIFAKTDQINVLDDDDDDNDDNFDFDNDNNDTKNNDKKDLDKEENINFDDI